MSSSRLAHAKAGGGSFRPARPFDPSRPKRRQIVGTILALLLVQSAAASGLWAIRHQPHEQPLLLGTQPSGTGDAAAFAGQSWVGPANEEMAAATSRLVYTSFVGSSIRDFTGTYVNVTNQARHSYVTALDGTRPVDVWFFGGSAMFGFDIQRDSHTIASEFVRLAEADNIAVRAKNFGSPGWVNYQGVTRLSLLLAQGQRPDVVVLYDGMNDITTQMLTLTEPIGNLGQPAGLSDYQMRQLFGPESSMIDLRFAPPAPLTPNTPRAANPTATVANAVHDVVAKGDAFGCSLAHQFNFDLFQFWQPTIFTKAKLDPGEQALFDSLGLDEPSYRAMSRLHAAIEQQLPQVVISVSNALDQADGPVFADLGNTNEQVAHLVAEAMYRHLKPELTNRSTGMQFDPPLPTTCRP